MKGVKRPAKKEQKDRIPAAKEQAPDREQVIAAKQRNSLIMFISAFVLASVIFIPGDMIWLWLHNAVRGMFSMLALFWPIMLLFLAVVTMLDREIPRLVFRTSFTAGFVAALNACIYIFTYRDTFNIHQTFTDGITYRGGGILGFLLGAPFVKLFGIIPAKILIIIALLVLAFFAFGDLVKGAFRSKAISFPGKLAQSFTLLKDKFASRRPANMNDDDYFGDNEFDEFDIGANDEDDENEHSGDSGSDTDDPHAMSEELFTDEGEYFPEDEEDAEDDITGASDGGSKNAEKEEYSIDIDIDSPAEPIKLEKDGGDKAKADGGSDDNIFEDIFGDDFLDTVDEGYRPEADKKTAASKKAADKPTVKKAKKRAKKSYIFPPTELLSESKSTKINHERELKENAKKLIDTLESFSIGAKIVGYSRGPSVTRYEIQPAPGIKISRITGLSDDIAMNLAAAGGVRMEAPIPGKAAIGVEIPNKTVTSVSMRELFESNEFNKNKGKKTLECVIGKDVSGKIVIMDLAKMPHLLIAGTTGSGKSVCVNSILMSILYRATPDEVKLILIDPKLVEFSKYKGIPHLLIPVVSDVKKAAGALGWAVTEMEDRYKELSRYNVKDIDSYNRMVDKNLSEMTPEEIENPGEGEVINGEFIPPKATKKMSKIVIAIDELADLMMAAPGEVEDYICRLAQKARAAGMHLVIATQRPSVNVITGVIKANIPSRISLKVASFVDSKTILDTGGGEKLIGKGDMLYSPVESSKPIRVQGGFSTDEDIEAVTDFIKQHASSEYDENISEEIERISEMVGVKGGAAKENDAEDFDDSDPMLEQAIEVVIDCGQASTSLLQRKLRLGYARAGRIIDTMEKMGIVGPHEGSKSRKVLITKQEWIERKTSGNHEK